MNNEEILLKHLRSQHNNHISSKKKVLWDDFLPSNGKINIESVFASNDVKVVDGIKKWQGQNRSNLLILGSVGVGKTTLAVALGEWAFTNYKNLVPAFVKYQDIFALRLEKTLEDARRWERIMNADLLVLDDIIASDKELSDWKHETLYTLLDHRYVHNKPTIITTNLTKEDLKGLLGKRINDRLRSNLVTLSIQGDSRR